MIKEVISIIKDLCISSAAIITALVAIKGLKSWSDELKGKVNFEVARKLIRDTYRLRDEIKYSRSPFTSANEFPEGYDPINKTNEEELKAWSHIFTNRWKPILIALQEFEAQTLEAEALWGERIKNSCLELKKCATKLSTSMDCMLSDISNNHDDFNSDKEFAKQIKADIWSTSKATDQLSKRINSAIENIEKELRPYLKRMK